MNVTRNVLLLPLLIAGFSVAPVVAPISAQTFTRLHTFTTRVQTAVGWTNSDGVGPDTRLILSGNTLYGTTYYGGTNGWGTVFAVNTDGTGFTTLHGFTRGTGGLWANDISLRNSDGAQPGGGLVLSGNTLYGTAYFGGTNGTGTVFALNTDGTAFATLHSFTGPVNSTNIDGANPSADLLLSSNTLYGTCYRGGSNDSGTVFALNTDGTSFRVLHSFPAYSAAPDYTNSEGGGLFSGLVLSGNTLYGAASFGGSPGHGTVFALNTDGTSFRVLHSFTASSDGVHPSQLLLSGNILYGTAQGGSSGNGTLFALNTDGTGFTNLHSFTSTAAATLGGAGTNSDGAYPVGGLLLSGNTLYGTANFGGSSGSGTVFSVNLDGTAFTTVYSFTATPPPNAANDDGANPAAGLVLSRNILYGTAYWGGSFGAGTIFSISLLPQLTTYSSGTDLVLTWPTNFTSCTLQSTTSLAATAVWTPISAKPVVVNGQNTVTNPILGTQQFFRLSQ
jgi:uncharacterized repeat protein (TIGR03803 family)